MYSQIIKLSPDTSGHNLNKFREVIVSKDLIKNLSFDLNSIIPCPEEFEKIPARIFSSNNSESREISKRLINEYGYDSAEDWKQDNWAGMRSNIISANWLDEYTLQFTSKDRADKMLSKMVKMDLGIEELFYAYCECDDEAYEKDCDIMHINTLGRRNVNVNPKIHAFRVAFASQIYYGEVLDFEAWEKKSIDGSSMVFYTENFGSVQARDELKHHFEYPDPIILASKAMVDTKDNNWETLKKILK